MKSFTQEGKPFHSCRREERSSYLHKSEVDRRSWRTQINLANVQCNGCVVREGEVGKASQNPSSADNIYRSYRPTKDAFERGHMQPPQPDSSFCGKMNQFMDLLPRCFCGRNPSFPIFYLKSKKSVSRRFLHMCTHSTVLTFFFWFPCRLVPFTRK